MSLLNELKLFCESEQLNTVIRSGATIVKLTKDKIGKCYLIYGCYRYYATDESDFFIDLENKLSVLAIYWFAVENISIMFRRVYITWHIEVII